MKRGIVYFVGAGPGDPELLTIKGRRVLREADVVVFDRLVNPVLLTGVKDGAKLVYCGKQPCQHFLRQEDIQKELLIHARKGHVVVRLKGGDPAVFGRVGEEAELLSENKIAYEIIPGITAGIAAPLYSGVTVTHRKHSSSFAVVSGHGKTSDGKPSVNWKSLASGVDTIVFYMGVKHLEMIAEELVRNGKDKNTAVLIIQWGTYSKQQTIEGSLATIVNQVKQSELTNPAIIIVGDVIKMRKKLQWFDNRSLSGNGIFLPSTDHINNGLSEQLRSNGADVYAHPNLTEYSLIKDHSFKETMSEIRQFEEIVFLSSYSVSEFIKAVSYYNLDIRMIRAQFFAATEQVKNRLNSFGFQSKTEMVPKMWINPLLVGGMDDDEGIPMSLPKESRLVTHNQKALEGEVQSFKRLIEEGHVNTLILVNAFETKRFIRFLSLSHLDPQVVTANLRIICKGKEANLILKAHGIDTQIVLDSTATNDQVLALLMEDTRLAIES